LTKIFITDKECVLNHKLPKILKKEEVHDNQQVDDSGDRSENDGDAISGQAGSGRQGTKFDLQGME
jgi:hypothetical protein